MGVGGQGTVAIRDVARAHGKPGINSRFRGCNVTTERNEVVAVLRTNDDHVPFSIIQTGCHTEACAKLLTKELTPATF